MEYIKNPPKPEDIDWQADLSAESTVEFIDQKAAIYRFTVSDRRNLYVWLRDLAMWGYPKPCSWWPKPRGDYSGKTGKQKILETVKAIWLSAKEQGPDYKALAAALPVKRSALPLLTKTADLPGILAGRCPVLGDKLRCCRLVTLDLIQGCAYDCSYCSVAAFYGKNKPNDGQNRVYFHQNLRKKLNACLNDKKTAHIGTGQSSDSLLWGNQANVLDELYRLARCYPQAVFELKTKSANVAYLLEKQPPANLIVSWSLNPQSIITVEESGAASLEERLSAAKKVAASGIKVGFHFHPIIRHKDWRTGYRELVQKVLTGFNEKMVVMVSLGVLTFTKSRLKQIRRQKRHTWCLQTRMEPAAGRYSYPPKSKKALLGLVYDSFKPWHDKVFFYLCMEDPALWRPVLGREYRDNRQFEADMLARYREKLAM